MKKEINEYSLFKPTSSRGLKFDYPELSTISEFQSISSSDLLFVWYFACETSPFVVNIEEESKRVKEAVKMAYKGTNLDGQKKKKLENLNFSDKLNDAIKKMSSFRVGPRVRGKMMIEKIMETYEDIVDVDTDAYFKNKDGDVDFSKKKAYVDATSTISKNMSVLISQLESGFGVSEKESSDSDIISLGDGALINTFHEQT